MKARTRMALVAMFTCVALAPLGCTKQPVATPPAVARPEAGLPAAPAGPGNVIGRLLAASLAEVNLRPDQKSTIEGLRADLKARSQPVRDARKDIAMTLANGVAAGAIDRPKADAQIARLVQVVQASTSAVQDSVNKLHGALDPSQRKQLVETMRAKGQSWAGQAREQAQEGHGPMRERMKKFADELGLTREQRLAVRDKLREMRPDASIRERGDKMRSHMKVIGDAFESEQFDARALGVGENAVEVTQLGARRIVAIVDAVQSVLTAEQRTKLAAMIRARAESDVAD